MQTLTLNNNTKIPSLGLGTWRLPNNEVAKVVEKAILNLGYRHIDCAHIYGNEKEIGEAFKNIFSSDKILRKDVFITSKLWNTEHHPDNVEKACRKSLEDFKLEYLDLFLIHWGIAFAHGGEDVPMGKDGIVKREAVPVQETWHALERLVEKGLVKNIGVANFTTPMLIDLLSYAKIKPAMNQVEIHPYNTQEELVNFCHKQNIQVTAYSPLGSTNVNKNRPLDDKEVIKISNNHKKTPAQVLLKWSIQRNLIVIPKSANLSRIGENIDIFDFELSKEEMVQLNNLNKNHRFVNPVGWGIHYFT